MMKEKFTKTKQICIKVLKGEAANDEDIKEIFIENDLEADEDQEEVI